MMFNTRRASGEAAPLGILPAVLLRIMMLWMASLTEVGVAMR